MLLKSILRNGSLLSRASVLEGMKVRGAATEGSERDLVNFPRVERLIYPNPTRFWFVPQSWFDAFYDKTGVTGPYMLGAGTTLFLWSKEIWIIEGEFWEFFTMFSVWAFLAHKFGPKYREWAEKNIKNDDAEWDQARDVPIARMKEDLKIIDTNIDSANHQTLMFDARKENIQLQLEAEYRERLRIAHEKVKAKLDYHLQTGQVQKAFEQKHMGDWIVKSVKASLTPAQEAAALKQCLVDLKGLAAKA